MRIIKDYREFPEKNTAVVLGNFDGVHKGHEALIKRAVSYARDAGLYSCVYTFSVHPSKGSLLITDNCEKAEIFENLGADFLFLDDFERVRELSCGGFVRNLLCEKLSCKIAFCGENHFFGKGRSGSFETLKAEMEKNGGTAFCEKCLKYGNDIISSTRIREYIGDGNTETAAELLGRPYSLTAPVIHGRKLARSLGTPTINQSFPHGKIVPKNGVYASVCTFDGKKYIGVANVGVKPTVTDGEKEPPLLCETYILDFDGDIYGKSVKTEFYSFLRSEKKFSSVEELGQQIKNDEHTAREYFRTRKDIKV